MFRRRVQALATNIFLGSRTLRVSVGILIVCGVTAEIQRRVGLNHDVAWYVHLAERVSHGAQLYVDTPGGYIEVNPPLVVWILLPVLRLARLLGVPVTQLPVMLVAVEVALGVALSALIIRRISPQLLPLTWLLAVTGLWLPEHAFGQREHQVVLLFLPAITGLVVASGLGDVPKWLRVSAGFSAGIGSALKPHFIIAWVMLEVSLAMLDRQPKRILRLETITGAVVVGAYGLMILVFEPSYLDVVRVWGPLYLQMSTQSFADLILNPDCVATLLVFLAVSPLRRLGEWGRVAFVFALAAVAFLVAVFLQKKGFDYHWLPSFAFSFIALGASLGALNRVSSRVGIVPFIHVLGVTMLLLVAARMARGVSIGAENRRLAAAFEKAIASDRDSEHVVPLVLLSSNLGHAFPMVTMLGYSWPQRWPSLWALETASQRSCHPPSGPHQALEQRVRDDLWDDLSRAAPRTLIVARLPEKMDPRSGCVTFVDHLATEARFAALFGSYETRDTIPAGHYPPFLILRRRPKGVITRR